MYEHERDRFFCDLTFESAIEGSISANIAVLDASGEILAVNLGWQEFADANQMDSAALLGIGANYLSVCRAAILDPSARAALYGIRHVMKGRLRSFYHEYACHSPWEKRWFALRATPLLDYPTFVVTSHENITDRILAAGTETQSTKN